MSLVLLLPVTVVWAFFLGGHWQSFKVISRSMEPTLAVNDYLLMRRQAHYPVLKHKIVVLRDPRGGLPLVKRVVAGPFSIIRLINGKIYIDNSTEPLPGPALTRFADHKWVLDEDEIFVLGDNLLYSEDSIDLGPFKRDDIMGVIFYRYWPASRMGSITG